MDMPNMGLTSALQRDLRRALRDHQYDRCEDGRLYVPKAQATARNATCGCGLRSTTTYVATTA